MKKGKDPMGSRLKENYELIYTSQKFPRRMYLMVRCDGKAFHTFTKRFNKPFDDTLANAMNQAAIGLAKHSGSPVFGYVQSDEISFVFTDFETNQKQAWFDNEIQKIVSICSSMVTSHFMSEMAKLDIEANAYFDCKAWVIGDYNEVLNTFIWRQDDCVKNSISMVAQSKFSTKQLHGVTTNQMQDMLFQEYGINWNDFDPGFKRGRVIIKEEYKKYLTKTELSKIKDRTKVYDDIFDSVEHPFVWRKRWVAIPAFDFRKDKPQLIDIIPQLNNSYDKIELS